MKYKNIIFDFGNVLATFDPEYILRQFCSNEEDLSILQPIVFENWQALDDGLAELSSCIELAVSKAPVHLKETVRNIFCNWYQHLVPLTQTWDFIHELKRNGYSIYILSNASVQFAEHASYYEIVKEFDGIIFSGPVKHSKPNPEIYQYLFETYNLNPGDCFFLDDKAENIQAGQNLGMEGIIFTGDIKNVRKAIDL